MDKIKGILFDKDGTILDFDSIWVPVAIKLVEELIVYYELEVYIEIKEKLLSSIGIEEGKVKQESPLVYGTARDLSENLGTVISGKKSVDIEKLYLKVRKDMNKLVKNSSHLIKPKGNVIKALKELKERGIKIGLATSDTHESAIICLEKLEVMKYFDYVGADDGKVNTKPNPDLLYNFCSSCRLKPEEVAVVGDSVSDMLFANNGNAALAIAVLSERVDRDLFQGTADYMIKSVEELLDGNGQLVWC